MKTRKTPHKNIKEGLNKREKKALLRITLAVLLLSLLCIAFIPGRSLYSHHQLKKEIKQLRREITDKEERIGELTLEINRLQNDDAYLEQIARDKYGMLKKNEEVYEIE